MTTAQDVFDQAMALIDEVNETTGATDTGDTREYKLRTLFLLNTMRGELYPFSDTYDNADANTRGIAGVISDFESPIDLDDYICQTIMPYGLAALLMLDENPSSASFFNQKYEELKAGLARGLSKVSEDITDIYGGIQYNEFAYW